ncbi:MAG: DUF1258 domain-containing protein [Pseudomonadota bacterium]
MIKRIKQKFLGDSCRDYVIQNGVDWTSAALNLKSQMEILLEQHYDTILAYRSELKYGNGDVLSSANDIDDMHPMVLHLHLSTDGGQPFTFAKKNLWPLQAILLDLPFHIRCKKENVLLLALWMGNSKPNWYNFLNTYLRDSIVNKTTSFIFGNSSIHLKIRISTAVFDLPALASVLNHNQYNGVFGCIYCCAPGSVVRVGKGHSRKYGGICDLRCDESYLRSCEIADQTGESIFGSKGHSCLRDYVNIPSGIVLDSLHLLFENCTKTLLRQLIDLSSFRNSYNLGRHLSHFENVLGQICFPHFMQKPRSLKEMSYWKARDYQNFLFYFSLPTIYVSLFHKPLGGHQYALHFLSFIIASKYCYSPLANSFHEPVKCLFEYFHSNLNVLYGENVCSVNMHLLLHLSDQIRRYGPLPYCSMFTFENQFLQFKKVHQGTSSVVSQICDKFMLMKHCKKFLKVCNYEKKKDILKVVFPSALASENRFIDEGQVFFEGKRFLSRVHKKKSSKLSTVYEIIPTKGYTLVDAVRFRMFGGSILVDVEYLSIQNTPIVQFDTSVFPNTSTTVLDIVRDRPCFFTASHSSVTDTIPLTSLLHACVIC